MFVFNLSGKGTESDVRPSGTSASRIDLSIFKIPKKNDVWAPLMVLIFLQMWMKYCTEILTEFDSPLFKCALIALLNLQHETYYQRSLITER